MDFFWFSEIEAIFFIDFQHEAGEFFNETKDYPSQQVNLADHSPFSQGWPGWKTIL